MIQSKDAAHADIPNRPQVDRLLIELSARFISLRPDQVDQEIESAQRQICECLGLDRSTLWMQPADEPDVLVLTHAYQSNGESLAHVRSDAVALFPWTVERLKHGESIRVASLADLPAEAARDKETWVLYGTKSTLIIPLSIGGAEVGVLTFATVTTERDWPQEIVDRLGLFAQVFANAIARARSDRTLRESQERFALAVEGANDGLWDWNIATGSVYYSRRWKRMLGYDAHELADEVSTWKELLHPDDCEAAQLALQAHLAGQTDVYESEHRLRCKDGSYRWILARGKALRDSQGRPYRMAGSHSDVTSRKEGEVRLRQAYDELKRLRDQLQQENVYLRSEMTGMFGQGRLVGQSRALRQILAKVEQVAPLNSTVLLLGETGTGKELVASAIHEASPRSGRAMVRVNCAAIPASLLESELFGREKGAYTGALSRQIGRFEMANGSTLFLDEIGDLPPDIQVKLLRVLQEKQIERLGSSKTLKLDVRIIAATNRDLDKAVREGTFREDLFYGLNVFPITVPPLRERRDDIPLLASAFVNEFAVSFGKNIESLDKRSMERLQSYHWPGNVRELRNVIERAMITAKGPTLFFESPNGSAHATASCLTMREAECRHLRDILAMTGWRIRGKNGAAEVLGLKASTLESRLAKFGIRRPNGRTTK